MTKRTSKAFMMGLDTEDELPPPDPDERSTAGNWSRQAMRTMEANLEALRSEMARANEDTYQGILEGTIPIRIPIHQIEDRIGTDRIASPEDSRDEESFASLLENIRRRGLRQPIRVRAVDHDWRPDSVTPRDVAGVRFTLQSGRRRLQVLRELGQDALCFLSFTEDGSANRDDLEERFFENAVRKNLSSFERLYSIGLIARETLGTTQSQIGEIIGVSTSSVSRGLAVVEFREALAAKVDVSVATTDDIDAALKEIRAERLSSSPEAVRSRERRREKPPVLTLPFRKRNLSVGTVRLRSSPTGGRVLTIDSPNLTDERIEQILKAIEGL